MGETTYKRVLLKVSGEALAGEKRHGLDFGIISRVCDVIKEAAAMGARGRHLHRPPGLFFMRFGR